MGGGEGVVVVLLSEPHQEGEKKERGQEGSGVSGGRACRKQAK